MRRSLEFLIGLLSGVMLLGCVSQEAKPLKIVGEYCSTCDFPTNKVKSGRVIYGFCKVHNRYLPRGFIDCDKPNDLIGITYFASKFELTQKKKEKDNSVEAYVFDDRTGSWRLVGYFDLPYTSEPTSLLLR